MADDTSYVKKSKRIIDSQTLKDVNETLDNALRDMHRIHKESQAHRHNEARRLKEICEGVGRF